MLVYLDTWLWSRVSQARVREPARFESFRAIWRECNCELAISQTHLFELRRHGAPEERGARYELLEALLPGRFDMLGDKQPVMNTVTSREIAVAHGRGLNLEVMPRVDAYWAGFPLPVRDEGDVAVLRQVEAPDVGAFLNLLYDALTYEAASRRRPRTTRYQRVRLAALPTNKPSAKQVDALVRQIESQIKDYRMWQLASQLYSADQLAELQAEGLQRN
jgi:hypothetical protein